VAWLLFFTATGLAAVFLVAGIARHAPPRITTDAVAQGGQCCASRDQPGGTACVPCPRPGRERREVGR
jgi:hypothetical protein